MPRALSAVYTVKHSNGREVEQFQISYATLGRAEKGFILSRAKICEKIQRRFEDDFGYDQGPIQYEDLTFKKIRDVPTRAKLPPKMKPARSKSKQRATTR